jgi:hypothetical protein
MGSEGLNGGQDGGVTGALAAAACAGVLLVGGTALERLPLAIGIAAGVGTDESSPGNKRAGTRMEARISRTWSSLSPTEQTSSDSDSGFRFLESRR